MGSIVAAARAVLTTGTQTVCMATSPRQSRLTSTCRHPKTESSKAFCTTSSPNASTHLYAVTVVSAPFQLNLFVHSVTGLITTILVFRIHAGMQVPCCSQRSLPGCSLTLAVRPPSQALHAGSPLPTTTNSLLTQQPDHRLTERMGATGSYLLNRALAAAEQHADRSQVNAAKFLSARYYFFERSGKTLHKCLAYTSASQTSTAVVAALGDFTEKHYWMCVQI
eukprot:COSAG02_NODE_14868_length_1228_cov_1.066430_2_plen_223_part_00